MANSYWLKQEKKFFKAIKNAKVPNTKLEKVDHTMVKTANDLKNIPNGGGCYWIWTNESVKHSLHKHKLPKKFKGGEIIYNGVAKDDVKGRICHHLFGSVDAGWSGISIDIYTKRSKSHRKKACSKKGKVPFVGNNPIRERSQLLKIFLSNEEKKFISKNRLNTYYFRNGIDITEKKHRKFKFNIFYIIGLKSLYLEHIEKEWRKNGLPRLCTYLTGR